MNHKALWIGLGSCLGISIVGNFQETNVRIAHYVGAISCFGCGTIYFWMQVRIHFFWKSVLHKRSLTGFPIGSHLILPPAVSWNNGQSTHPFRSICPLYCIILCNCCNWIDFTYSVQWTGSEKMVSIWWWLGISSCQFNFWMAYVNCFLLLHSNIRWRV